MVVEKRIGNGEGDKVNEKGEQKDVDEKKEGKTRSGGKRKGETRRRERNADNNTGCREIENRER